jgi:hypothetical protein
MTLLVNRVGEHLDVDARQPERTPNREL